MKKHRYKLMLMDFLLLGISYLLMTWYKGSFHTYYSDKYLVGITVMALIWMIISGTFNKMWPERAPSNSITLHIIMINILILGVVTILMYGFRREEYSRLIVFGTIGITTILEIISHKVFRLFVANGNGNGNGTVAVKRRKKQRQMAAEAARKEAFHEIRIRDISISETQLKKDITEECGEGAFNFINENIDLLDPRNLVIATTTRFNLVYQPEGYLQGIVNLKRINDTRYINKFFETVNTKLPREGIYIGCAETTELRKKRILAKFPPGLNWIYYFFDYIIKRVLPKFNLTKKLYFFLTRGQNRVITRAEILGRLYSCGFSSKRGEIVNGHYFFVAKKVKKPSFDKDPTYGALVRLSRVGKDGKMIRVFKMRTMHPYAEYLQDYIYQRHDLQEGGKFNNDFRISYLGRVMRIFWIDELPMLINWLRGDLRLVGVRPITEHYMALYSKEHQERRIKYKPGLVPPYYAHLPKSLEEIEASEKKFLDEYDRHPFRTNWKIFWKAWYNIIFKRARSR